MDERRALPEVALEPGTRIVADLHLDLCAPEGPRAFLKWLGEMRGMPHLVVLGDLFDVWVGPAQERMSLAPAVLDGLRDLTARGTRLDVVHGNRDFLLERRFEARTGARVHPRGMVGLLPGPKQRRALLIHGDELCTADLGYQRLKRAVRSRPLALLAPRLPLAIGARLARALRRSSIRALAVKLPEEKAMQAEACRDLAATHRAQIVVCGHAHAFRDVDLEGGPRWIVIDAFGGERDVVEIDGGGELRFSGSNAL